MPHDSNGLAGKRFGRLIVLEKCGSIKKKGYSRSIWLCRCDCGKEVTIAYNNLVEALKRFDYAR